MAAFLKNKNLYLPILLFISANAIATPAELAESDFKIAFKAYENKIEYCADLEVKNKASEKLVQKLNVIPKQHLSILLPYYSFTAFHKCLQPEEAQYLVAKDRTILFNMNTARQGAVSTSKSYVELKYKALQLPQYKIFEQHYFQQPYKASAFFKLID
ncbi:MAG: hypothetical protein HRT95_16690 [Moritella sp.]|uniref:hypothetical protein n=1 Tax=Moritella sp. TaxID=78556 RepID=UPI001D21E3AE|nr:hypothetical protein [Moritella sp.]NQZ51745.1 hypothetical protein [Moritella sp.]